MLRTKRNIQGVPKKVKGKCTKYSQSKSKITTTTSFIYILFFLSHNNILSYFKKKLF
jgi:hypothetical protein